MPWLDVSRIADLGRRRWTGARRFAYDPWGQPTVRDGHGWDRATGGDEKGHAGVCIAGRALQYMRGCKPRASTERVGAADRGHPSIRPLCGLLKTTQDAGPERRWVGESRC